MFKPGYWTFMEVNGTRERVELLSVQPLPAENIPATGSDEVFQAFGLTWEVVGSGIQFSEKRHKLVECDCDFCCEEEVGAGDRVSVAQM